MLPSALGGLIGRGAGGAGVEDRNKQIHKPGSDTGYGEGNFKHVKSPLRAAKLFGRSNLPSTALALTLSLSLSEYII